MLQVSQLARDERYRYTKYLYYNYRKSTTRKYEDDLIRHDSEAYNYCA